ncbi:hypothetical protein M3Y96_00996000 [Aphelenchoides besseyi]|nr:hypothetical protein M3Y96_00996000 [Aphelenchoides besseyi]
MSSSIVFFLFLLFDLAIAEYKVCEKNFDCSGDLHCCKTTTPKVKVCAKCRPICSHHTECFVDETCCFELGKQVGRCYKVPNELACPKHLFKQPPINLNSTAATTKTTVKLVMTSRKKPTSTVHPTTRMSTLKTLGSTPAQTSTPTPAPTPAATSTPTPAQTSAQTSASTPAPTPAATSTPTPAATSTPTPAQTSAQTSAPTPAPTPAATSTPTPAQTPAPIYPPRRCRNDCCDSADPMTCNQYVQNNACLTPNGRILCPISCGLYCVCWPQQPSCCDRYSDCWAYDASYCQYDYNFLYNCPVRCNALCQYG